MFRRHVLTSRVAVARGCALLLAVGGASSAWRADCARTEKISVAVFAEKAGSRSGFSENAAQRVLRAFLMQIACFFLHFSTCRHKTERFSACWSIRKAKSSRALPEYGCDAHFVESTVTRRKILSCVMQFGTGQFKRRLRLVCGFLAENAAIISRSPL